MLTPLAGAGAAAIVSTMQSIIETMEERHREEADKANGRKPDDTPKPALASDETARQANARINAYFFGADARNDNTMAKLISRFAEALGLTQREGESGRAFARRLADAVTLIDSVESSGKPLSVTLKSLGTTLDAVKAAMDGRTDDPAAALVARIADAEGVRQSAEESDADFEARLSNMLTAQRNRGPKDIETLEERTGLAALGLKATDLIAAIANPYGSEAARVKDALSDKAREEKSLTPEMRKVLARLEDVADPKTIEELKAERIQRDPTRVEDAETRAEREEDIRALEAGEKLEDVRKLQDAVSDAGKDGEAVATDPVEAAMTTIQVLAAGAEAAKRADETAKEPQETEADKPVETTDEALRQLDEAGVEADRARAAAEKDVFTLRVDENGIYDLITRRLAA